MAGRSGLSVMVLAAVSLASLLVVLAGTKPAEAAFQGTNGRIFFDTSRSGFTEIWTVNPNDSADIKKLVGTDDRNAESNPAVSPDGSRVAYEYVGEIWVMNANGTAPRQLTNPSVGSDGEPTWSPDGTRIAFTRTNGDREIWAMNADGSGQTNLTKNPNNEERDPAWSPLGDKISYTRTGCEVSGGGGVCVYSMNADGSGQINLTPKVNETDALCERMPGTGPYGESREPSWSPNGSKIVFTSRPDCTEGRFGGTEIWVMNDDGTGETNITGDDFSDELPAFSPDGQQVTFSSDRDNSDFEIYTTPAGGGAITQLTDTVSSVRDENADWGVARPKCTMRVNATNDPLVGTAGDDVLCGDDRSNTINGAGGDDIVLGEGGSDALSGALGRDTLNGGPGIDTATFIGSANAVNASLTTGFARRLSTAPLEGVALVGVENLKGTSLDDTLTGSAGKNELVGGSGADKMFGLANNDALNSRDGVNDNDTLDGGSGTDSCTTDTREASVRSCP